MLIYFFRSIFSPVCFRDPPWNIYSTVIKGRENQGKGVPTPSAGTRQSKRPIRSTRKLRGVPDTPVANEVCTASAACSRLFPRCNSTPVSLWHSIRLLSKYVGCMRVGHGLEKLAQRRVCSTVRRGIVLRLPLQVAVEKITCRVFQDPFHFPLLPIPEFIHRVPLILSKILLLHDAPGQINTRWIRRKQKYIGLCILCCVSFWPQIQYHGFVLGVVMMIHCFTLESGVPCPISVFCSHSIWYVGIFCGVTV